jgi:hypothetical protein
LNTLQVLEDALMGDAFKGLPAGGFITGAELFSYVQEHVYHRARILGGRQTPQFGRVLLRHRNRNGDGQFLFAHAGPSYAASTPVQARERSVSGDRHKLL